MLSQGSPTQLRVQQTNWKSILEFIFLFVFRFLKPLVAPADASEQEEPPAEFGPYIDAALLSAQLDIDIANQ